MAVVVYGFGEAWVVLTVDEVWVRASAGVVLQRGEQVEEG